MSQEPQRRMDGYRPEDMAIPTWNLLQKTGGDWAKALGGQPGQFHNTGSDEIRDELNLIVVDILMGRARWSSEISDQGPLCASQDAQGNTSINGDDCTQCPYRLDTPWSVEATERRKMCCLNYTILGITIEDYMPCIIRAHGISALALRQLISQLRLNRSIKGEYFRAVVNIKSQEKTGKYGAAFALHPRILRLITDEAQAIELKGESNRLLGTPVPLPEGRPEDDLPEPIDYPAGVPYYSENQADRQEPTTASPPVQQPPSTAAKVVPPVSTKAEPAQPVEKEAPEVKATEGVDTTRAEDLDLDF